MRNRRATGRAAADSNALFGSEADKPANTSEAIAVSLPVIGMPTVSLCPLPYCCDVKELCMNCPMPVVALWSCASTSELSAFSLWLA